jgi:predicted TIM-barrel fold metal-dependent hydrolase
MEQVLEVARPPSARELLAGIPVVDVDTHISEWYDLWTARAPANMKDKVPQIRKTDDGLEWIINGDRTLGFKCAASAIRKDGFKPKGWDFLQWQNPDVYPASYDMKARLDYMDEQGIRAQIAYPNVLGFGGQNAMTVDADLRLLSTQLYNDAMADVQADSGNRIYPMALLPWWDVDLAVAEAIRCSDMGLRGININPDPHNHGLPPLGDTMWDPLWTTCCDRGLPVNFHIGASDESMSWAGAGFWPQADHAKRMAFGATMLFVNNLRVMANILLDGFLNRFPELKMVSVESGAGWVPFLLEALEYQANEAGLDHGVPIRDTFHKHLFLCTWFERKDFVERARSIGIDNIMFETDFPHPTCLYPEPLQYMAEPIAAFTVEERRKVFGGTASRIYNLDLGLQ